MSIKFKSNIFSQPEILRLKQDLINYENQLMSKTRLLCKKLADLGVEIAKARITELDAIFTGELRQSITSQDKSGGNKVIFCVVADNAHAVFVEFGTGIVGKTSPYPYELPDGVSWEYASGKTIRQLADGRYGWFYQRDGKWYFTEGMPSRPFMHDTSIQLGQNIQKIAKEVFV